MSAQPIWITPSGSLGTVPEGAFYQVPLQVSESDGSTVYFKAISGSLPVGIYCNIAGVIQGIPTPPDQGAIFNGADIVSKFTIRAYTTIDNTPTGTVKRLADRTFTITISGQNISEWITPAGRIAECWTGQLLNSGIQLEYLAENIIPGVTPVTLISGSLPPGLTISGTGLISGFITAPSDSSIINYNTTFTLKVTNGRTSSLRTFNIYVWDVSTFIGSTTLIDADDSFLEASISIYLPPVITNPQGSLGTVANSNFFAYQFTATDLNNVAIGFIGNNLPPGLTLDTNTGWLYGYLPYVGITEITYDFTVQAYPIGSTNPDLVSGPYSYSLTITGPINGTVTWISPANLGDISNGSPSLFQIQATTVSGIPLYYKIKSGSDSLLPQGLTLETSGDIVGRVSFILFELDNGTTTIDNNTTTIDRTFTFTVTAYSSSGDISVDKTFTITVLDTYPQPYNNLYIQCMPSLSNRAFINNLLTDKQVFPNDVLFRADDPNFGLASNVTYYHAYGLTAATLEDYVTSLELNHYWKNLTLGQFKTAQALDELGNVIYEIVYSEVVDNLVNNDGISVGKQVVLPYPLNVNTPQQINDVYPNALVDMRQQVIDVVGQVSNILPRWMTSNQTDGSVLGFTPAWVIAYLQPGTSGKVLYNLQNAVGDRLNLIDFEADRYELDCALTVNWNPVDQQWIPSPAESTSFDGIAHYQTTTQNYEAGGFGYAVGDVIKILGTQLGGTSPLNDCYFTVDTINPTSGAILNAFCYGNANLLVTNRTFSDVSGTNVTGSGYNAIWDINVVPGVQTVFDGNSLQFNTPADIDTNTQAFDRYILFPKYNILDSLPTES